MFRFLHRSPLIAHSTIELDKEQSHHLKDVVRLREGETVEVFDGTGNRCKGVIESILRHTVLLKLSQPYSKNRKPRIQLCFGIPKGPALEAIFRHGTEMGVASFQPVSTEFGLRIKELNTARFEKIIIESCRQCDQDVIPEILPISKLPQCLEVNDRAALVVCDEHRRENKNQLLKLPHTPEFRLFIGPEGGWSPQERSLFEQSGCEYLTLGETLLRVDTATIAAIARLQVYIEQT